MHVGSQPIASWKPPDKRCRMLRTLVLRRVWPLLSATKQSPSATKRLLILQLQCNIVMPLNPRMINCFDSFNKLERRWTNCDSIEAVERRVSIDCSSCQCRITPPPAAAQVGRGESCCIRAARPQSGRRLQKRQGSLYVRQERDQHAKGRVSCCCIGFQRGGQHAAPAAEGSEEKTSASLKLAEERKAAAEAVSTALEAATKEKKALQVKLIVATETADELGLQVERGASERKAMLQTAASDRKAMEQKIASERKAAAEAADVAAASDAKMRRQLRAVETEVSNLQLTLDEKCASLRQAEAEPNSLREEQDKATRCWRREREAFEAAQAENERVASQLRRALKHMEAKMLQLTEEHDRMIAETRGAERGACRAGIRAATPRKHTRSTRYRAQEEPDRPSATGCGCGAGSSNDKGPSTSYLEATEEARLQDKKQVEDMRRALIEAEAVRDAALAARDEAVADAALACQAMANKDKIWETTQRSLAGLPRRVREDHLEIREVLASEGAWRSIGRAATQQQLEAPDRITASANPAKPRMRTLPTGLKTEETNVGGLLNDWKAEARMRFLQSVASQGAPQVSLIKPSGDP